MSHAAAIAVEVAAVEQVTPLINYFTLVPVDGGSHIIVIMRGANRVHRNPYSFMSAPSKLDAYEISVRRSDQSLLESIKAAGADVPYVCRGGVCGFCHTKVLKIEGQLIHNDAATWCSTYERRLQAR